MIDINKNNLFNDPSPYLQQHKKNPVNWQVWSTETIELAKKNSKPILLSIGYASCYYFLEVTSCSPSRHVFSNLSSAYSCSNIRIISY